MVEGQAKRGDMRACGHAPRADKVRQKGVRTAQLARKGTCDFGRGRQQFCGRRPPPPIRVQHAHDQCPHAPRELQVEPIARRWIVAR